MRLAFWKKKKEDPNKKKKPVWREWLDAAVFAIIAATIIRTFFIEAYTIPTPSMHGTLLTNDYLFVSKLAYGPRLPMTPLSVPLVHNTMPLLGGKSYIESVQWKYRRLPGFGKVKRYDVVVFNFPNNDTVMLDRPADDYYQEVRASGRDVTWRMHKIITRPVDKKENYIKRCVGIPGDVLEVRNGVLFVNNQQATIFPHQRMDYKVVSSNPNFRLGDDFAEENDISASASQVVEAGALVYNMEAEVAEKVKKISGVKSVEPYGTLGPGMIYNFAGAWTFPFDTAHFKWNQDNYGPITIPKKGTTITLTPENVELYKRVINIYEKNKLEDKGNGVYVINGKQTSQYTFNMDYYWMMGDNRHNSLDSRYFGFVPEDHVVGKASFVWLSYGEGGIRWNRLFRGVKRLESRAN